MDTAAFCLVLAPRRKNLIDKKQNESMARRKDFSEGTKGTVSSGLDGAENAKIRRASPVKIMQLICQEQALRLLKTIQRSFQKKYLPLFRHNVALDVYYTF